MVCSACGSNKTFTIYSISPDSVFYQDVEKFDPQKLAKGSTTDKSFMQKMQKDILASSSPKVYKPMAGNGGYIGKSIMDLKKFFSDNQLSAYVKFEETDSLEKSYFGQMSVYELQREMLKERQENPLPPPPIPFSGSREEDKTQPQLLFQVKRNGDILYRYDAPVNNATLKKIEPLTLLQVRKLLDEIEQQHGIKLDTMENRILVKVEREASFKPFKVVKDAFKQKEIYKFRIVTTAE